MIFKATLWYKGVGVLFLILGSGALAAVLNDWHIDNTREMYYLYSMSAIFMIVGLRYTASAFKYRLIISDSSIREVNAFKKDKLINIDDILKVVVYRHTARLTIITKDEAIVVNDTLRFYITFLRVLKQSIAREKLFFFKNTRYVLES
jgi:hypothetical protein